MILIVDDKPENVYSLKATLELHSFAADTAYSGEEALKKALKHTYSLIILDVQMPGMDGFEVAEILAGSTHTRDMPILFLSAANTEKKFITRGYSAGAIDYLVKPIDTDILLLKVKTFNRLYEQKRELNQVQRHLKSEIEFRKTAQVQIQEKAQELRSILESMPQIAFTATSQGDIDFVNEQWFAYVTSTLNFPANHPDDPDINTAWQQTVLSGKPMEIEIRLKKLKDKVYRYHLLRAIPVREKNKLVKWVGSFTDIEEQKQAIKKKDEFLSIASHELKTPLTSIKAYLQLLVQMTTADNASKSFMERTLLQVNKLDTLINDLLDVSKIENDKLKFEMVPLNFNSLLEATLEIFKQIYPTHRLIVHGTQTLWVNGNAARLEQVIFNFLTNAIKYAPNSKEIIITSKLTEQQELYFSVQDFGIGIIAENQAAIFDKFYRVSDSAMHIQGLGIGLYICSEILKMHQARYGVNSQPGKGAVFYFVLPVIEYPIHQLTSSLHENIT